MVSLSGFVLFPFCGVEFVTSSVEDCFLFFADCTCTTVVSSVSLLSFISSLTFVLCKESLSNCLFCSCSSSYLFSSLLSSSLSSSLDDDFSISLIMRDITFSPCNILSKKSMKEIASQFLFLFWIGRDKVKFSIVVFGPKEF